MFRCELRVWSSSKTPVLGNMMHARTTATAGFTLVELLVTLTILSILAAAALPFVETIVIRNKELELHRVLREVRTAIDNFHEDWANGKISKTDSAASEDGYPQTLQVLVDGIQTGSAKGGKHRYLRRIPRDPFAATDKSPEEGWVIRGYQDEVDTSSWNKKDVYDIHSLNDKLALDGTHYHDW